RARLTPGARPALRRDADRARPARRHPLGSARRRRLVIVLDRALSAVPLLPDGEEARDWAERELADPVYRAAEPTFFDRASRAVADFFARLFSPEVPDGSGSVALIVLAVVVIAAVVVGILVWGVPRATARSRSVGDALFDAADDGRSAEDLRREAAAAAARAEWDDAIVLRFRALARGLVERGIVETAPGATARAFARETSRALPALDPAVGEGAAVFDDVRYLRRPGTAERYQQVAALDAAAVAARPRIPDATGALP
ncbi:DUF4129 domain-containing protein, partial [Microbacterium enclense]|uniref:DUF4129 domain-containing protein n=1 Tax=Microbacterium enclense TaxID=993073 RepID=UPI0036DC8F78